MISQQIKKCLLEVEYFNVKSANHKRYLQFTEFQCDIISSKVESSSKSSNFFFGFLNLIHCSSCIWLYSRLYLPFTSPKFEKEMAQTAVFLLPARIGYVLKMPNLFVPTFSILRNLRLSEFCVT